MRWSPETGASRNGPKTDPSSVRVLGRRWRTAVGENRAPGRTQALSVLLAARRSAASPTGPLQVFSMVSPEPNTPRRFQWTNRRVPTLPPSCGFSSVGRRDERTVVALRTLLVARTELKEARYLRKRCGHHPQLRLLSGIGIGPIVEDGAGAGPTREYPLRAAFAMLAGSGTDPATAASHHSLC